MCHGGWELWVPGVTAIIRISELIIVYGKIEKNEMGWECGAYGWGDGVCRVLVGKPEGRRPLGRPRCRCVDTIRMDLQEVECGYVDWIGLAQDRDRWRTLVSAVMKLRVPWNAGNFLTSWKPVSFSRRTLHHGVSKYGIIFCVLLKLYVCMCIYIYIYPIHIQCAILYKNMDFAVTGSLIYSSCYYILLLY